MTKTAPTPSTSLNTPFAPLANQPSCLPRGESETYYNTDKVNTVAAPDGSARDSFSYTNDNHGKLTLEYTRQHGNRIQQSTMEIGADNNVAMRVQQHKGNSKPGDQPNILANGTTNNAEMAQDMRQLLCDALKDNKVTPEEMKALGIVMDQAAINYNGMGVQLNAPIVPQGNPTNTSTRGK